MEMEAIFGMLTDVTARTHCYNGNQGHYWLTTMTSGHSIKTMILNITAAFVNPFK